MAHFVVRDFDSATFPAIYTAADAASLSAQRWYTRWIAINLLLLVAGALVASFVTESVGNNRLIYVASAILFFAAVMTSTLRAFWRWDRIWYSGRAVAESAKSMTWKFVCGADPYPSDLRQSEAVDRFADSLRELVEEYKYLAPAMAEKGGSGDQITPWMENLRDAAVGVKRDVYLAQRVNDQREWYTEKSQFNHKHRTAWLILIILVQFAGLTCAVSLAVSPTMGWKGLGVFSAVASALVAWGQLKRYHELAQAYAVAAHELSLISTRGSQVATAAELARFVNDAETAISREHSMWVARRETK